MKKVILLVLILNFQFSILNSLRAQGFEWVKTYTGEEVTSGVTTNQLKGSCVDLAGNIYILGEFSPQAQLCGTNLLPFEVIETSRPRWQGVVIAKLSPSGELLWHKAIYNGKQGCYAHGWWAIAVSWRWCVFFCPTAAVPAIIETYTILTRC